MPVGKTASTISAKSETTPASPGAKAPANSATQTDGAQESTSYDTPAVTANHDLDDHPAFQKDKKEFPNQSVAPAGVQSITTDQGTRKPEDETEGQRLDRIRREADDKQRKANKKRIDEKAVKARRIQNGVIIDEAVQLD